MRDALESGLSLVDVSGYFIIATILVVLAIGVAATLLIRQRYGALISDLHEHQRTGAFASPVLRQIAHDALEAQKRSPHDVNTQVIIEHAFQAGLRPLLLGERFLKASTGLLIILGLVGTFYGLTLSIGKLAALVGGDVTDTSQITETLTAGLTQALSGMSVAFSTSLFGIVSAIIMTLFSVFFSVVDRRAEVLAQLENYLDNALLSAARAPNEPSGAALSQSVAQLEGVVAQFDAALQTFAANTRDFHEFNLHLKDNVQRMSLGFGDLSETLKEHARALKGRG
jgi:hypothetical protein